jgi:hypothetical protein
MSRRRVIDELLRRRALDVLGPLGDELARSALESGAVYVEHDVLGWQGSHGEVHAHRAVVTLPSELHARVVASHPARDGLAAALAAAMAERPGHSVADVTLEVGAAHGPTLGPYRDPRGGR